MVEPIRPEQILQQEIPAVVIDVFNDLIKRNYHDGRAVVKQGEAMKILEARGYSAEDLIANHWLDVEPLYEPYWEVEYHAPDRDQSFASYFVFTARKKS